jgi:ATP-dependent exoDNAse (exonuclease V) alpha subunit
MTQKTALRILKTGVNVFLTGEPGSGKSHTIREYVKYLNSFGIEPAITASTGIASTHIHGMTIHSWSGIGIKKNLSKYDIEAITEKSNIYKRIKNTQILIIDEISMLDASTLESADAVCRNIKGNQMEAFGGMQVVFVGDFFQLPPIGRREESAPVFSFDSKTWRDAGPIVCYLSEQHRQDDEEYLSLLSSIRKNSLTNDHKICLEKRLGQYGDKKDSMTRLFSHNENVDHLNNERLEKIKGELRAFTMGTVGKEGPVESLKRGCLSPEKLELKIGAIVMCTKNNPTKGFVNGTLGEIVEFEKTTGNPVIKTKSGRRIEIDTMEWLLEENGQVKARITQIPLRLAWAITIHKSQGMSLDEAVMNLSDVFEYGQGYVALSRVRRLKGLFLEGFNKKSLQVHPDILEKDIQFKLVSAEARSRFEEMSNDELLELHNNFIKALGGKLKTEEDFDDDFEMDKNPKKSFGSKKDTYSETKELLLEGKNISEIVSIRKIKEATVINHLEHLSYIKEINYDDLVKIIPKDKKKILEIEKIHGAFNKLGSEKMKPIFEHFDGEYSYDLIRLAKLFYETN